LGLRCGSSATQLQSLGRMAPMNVMHPIPRGAQAQAADPTAERTDLSSLGQVVLVLQGGGALGAYQVGVYEALHESGVEPDWVIGTSIGAINAALLTGCRG
jgi:predicted acylesterase/phospholipase RssA